MPRIKKQHLKQRKDGRFACRYKDLWFYGTSEDEALALRDEYKKNELTQNRQAMPTLSAYAKRWFPIAKANVADSTYRTTTILLEKLTKEHGSKPLDKVTPLDIKEVFSKRFIGLSDGHIRHARNVYIALFDAAVSEQYIRFNPAREKAASPHRGTKGSHRSITPQERLWIDTLCLEHPARPAVMAMLYEGLRPPEAKALDIDRDIDLEKGIINLTHFAHIDGTNKYVITEVGKTRKSARKIPLFPPFEDSIRGKHGALVSCVDGKPITVNGFRSLYRSYVNDMETAINGIRKLWYGRTREQKKLKEEGKLPPWISFSVLPYDLRHSFCTMCRDNDIEIHTVIEWMGHSDATMIMKIYDEVSEDRSQKEAEKLKKALFRSQNGSQTEKEG